MIALLDCSVRSPALINLLPKWDAPIETHGQDLMQMVLSIKAGKLMPSTILGKLGSYSRKNRVYLAFKELGRVIRAWFF